MQGREVWVNLIYRELDMGDWFKISNKGRIKNVKTNSFPKMKREHRIVVTRLYYKGTTYRIRCGDAQVESGLERTIEDTAPRDLMEFTKQQELKLDKTYGKRIRDQQEEIDILKDQVSRLIVEYKK